MVGSVQYFRPVGADKFDHQSALERGDWWKYTHAEAKAIRNGVGIIDATAFTKHIVKGPGASRFLVGLLVTNCPKVGRINLTYALTDSGTTRTEYTIVRLKQDEFYLVSACLDGL